MRNLRLRLSNWLYDLGLRVSGRTEDEQHDRDMDREMAGWDDDEGDE